MKRRDRLNQQVDQLLDAVAAGRGVPRPVLEGLTFPVQRSSPDAPPAAVLVLGTTPSFRNVRSITTKEQARALFGHNGFDSLFTDPPPVTVYTVPQAKPKRRAGTGGKDRSRCPR